MKVIRTITGAIVFTMACLTLLIHCGTTVRHDRLTERAKKIHEKILTLDTHIDTPMEMMRYNLDLGQRHRVEEPVRLRVDFPRMAEGLHDASFFVVFVGQKELTKTGRTVAKKEADDTIDGMEEIISRYPDLVEMAVSPEDAYRIEKTGKRIVFLGMENGYPIGTDLSLVEYFYNRNIRYITLCHSRNNDICDSATDETEWNGLSPFGEKVVKELNRLGMILDVSHASDSSFYDVLRLTKAPVVATHSNCRGICDHPRNLTDEMLLALKENGGVIQICLVSSFLKKNPKVEAAWDSLEQKYGNYYTVKDPAIKEEYRNAYREIRRRFPDDATVHDIVDHIDHVVNIIGIDHVGIGSDFDGGGSVIGCQDVTEFPNITVELLKRGYREEEIRKIWGGNFIRVFREIIRVSEEIQKNIETGSV